MTWKFVPKFYLKKQIFYILPHLSFLVSGEDREAESSLHSVVQLLQFDVHLDQWQVEYQLKTMLKKGNL